MVSTLCLCTYPRAVSSKSRVLIRLMSLISQSQYPYMYVECVSLSGGSVYVRWRAPPSRHACVDTYVCEDPRSFSGLRQTKMCAPLTFSPLSSFRMNSRILSPTYPETRKKDENAFILCKFHERSDCDTQLTRMLWCLGSRGGKGVLVHPQNAVRDSSKKNSNALILYGC